MAEQNVIYTLAPHLSLHKLDGARRVVAHQHAVQDTLCVSYVYSCVSLMTRSHTLERVHATIGAP